MDGRKIESDTFSGAEHRFHVLAGDEFAIETRQDVEPIIEANKAEYNTHDERAPWGTEGVGSKVATVPFVAFHEWLQQRNPGMGAGRAYRLFLTDTKLMAKFLNDPDNRYFRTRPGHV